MNTAKSYRMLVIEDNPGDYFLLREHLRMSDLPLEEIFHAESMTVASGMLKDGTFDIALLDLTLSDSNGVDSVITLDRLLPQTPIVVLSGLSTLEVARESISLGAQDYLVKGEFDEKLLAKSVQYSIERKKSILEAAEEKVRQQKIITEVTLLAQEREKEELGRELHDNISQVLATVKIYLSLIKSHKSPEPEALLDKSFEYVDYALEELRKLAHSLVAPSLKDSNLVKLLQELVKDINSFNRMQINLTIGDEISKIELDKDTELMIYRVLQEQMNNIIKYSRATLVSITLQSGKRSLHLTINDNGVGFDPMQKSEGIGLKNIKSRVDHHGGTMKLTSAPGMGCTLEIDVNL